MSGIEHRGPLTVASDALAVLRERLLDLRGELVERMATDGIEPAFLNLMAGVQAALGRSLIPAF